jgi:hypothetical protein
MQVSEASYNSLGAKISPQIEEERREGLIGLEKRIGHTMHQTSRILQV